MYSTELQDKKNSYQAADEHITLIQTLVITCNEQLKLIKKLNTLLEKKSSPNKSNINLEENHPYNIERNELFTHIEYQEKVIHNLKVVNNAREVAFLDNINTHFAEIYTRFSEIQQQIIQTSKDEIYNLSQKYKDLQREKLKLIEPLKKDLFKYQDNINWLAKTSARIRLFFTPKLGELNLYPARPLIIPKRYKKITTSKNLPTISIVTPSFNHGDFLERTINSILDQDYPELEYIIQDGNSSDNTLEIIQRYQSRLKHFASFKDNGQSHAINLGFRHATGEIMAYLNSDDMLLPGALHCVGEYFAKHPNVDVVYSHRILIDENDHEIGRWILPRHDTEILSWADYIPQETLFWRRSLWEKVGGKIDESFRFAMDWELILRFRDAGAKFVRLPRFLGMFRIHPHQKTSAQISQIGMEEMQRLRKQCHKRAISSEEIANATRSYLNRHLIYHKLYKAGVLQY